MNIYSIYRVTNTITGKVYIGFTSVKISTRINCHKRKAFILNSKTKFHVALRAYGWDSFTWAVIYQAKEDLPPKKSHTCKVMEDYFINEYCSLNEGYNSVPGGGAWPIMHGKDHPLYNKNHSDKSRQKIKLNHHDVSGSKNPMFGKKGESNPKALKFWAIDPNDNRYEGKGIANFCKAHGLFDSSVSLVLKGVRDQHKGWKFGYM